MQVARAAQVLFSRYEDGTKRVTALPTGGWEVEGAAAPYTTTKSLLHALTGHPEGRHWSLDRYFRLGSFSAPEPLAKSNVFDLFTAEPFLPTPLVVITPGISVPVENPEKALGEKNRSRECAPGLILGKQFGIDLRKRGHEVRKLLFAGFGRRMYLSGYDPEDVLQEVYKGLLIRNEGKCPWDENKSSFGHYVHMVCSCVLSNYHRKQHRVQQMEQVGLLNPLGAEDDGTRYLDVASNVTVPAKVTSVHEDALVLEEAQDLLVHMQAASQDAESRLAARVLPLLLEGSTPRDQLAPALGVSAASLSRALSHLRKQARIWHHQ